jgi:crotonobetainyl-CoA:carnitine CoA-transferase CaiB-like acyl-CoA transferase
MAGRNLGRTVIQRSDLAEDEVKEMSLRVGAAAMSGANPDAISSLGVGTGLLLGLLARKRGAPGQAMLTTMLNTMGHCLSEGLVEYEGRPPGTEIDQDIFGFNALYRLYQAADGWVFLAVPTDRDWERLSLALGGELGPLAGDERLQTAEARQSLDHTLAEALAGVFRIRPARDWESDLTAAGVACVEVAPGPSEVTIWEGENAIGRQLDLIVDREHPVLGTYPRLKPLVTFSRSTTLAPATPALGQDTEAVLTELGYDPARIAELRAAGVIN